jgi:hypothetical protein
MTMILAPPTGSPVSESIKTPNIDRRSATPLPIGSAIGVPKSAMSEKAQGRILFMFMIRIPAV